MPPSIRRPSVKSAGVIVRRKSRLLWNATGGNLYFEAVEGIRELQVAMLRDVGIDVFRLSFLIGAGSA
jgi:hypothetical protein